VDLLKRELASQTQEQRSQALLVVLVQAAHATLQARGRFFDASYDRVASLHQALLQGFKVALSIAAEQSNAGLEQFAREYRTLAKVERGPFYACGPCLQRCLYRYDVSVEARSPNVEADFVQITNGTPDVQAMWRNLAALCREAAVRLLGEQDKTTVHQAAFCIGVQIASRLKLVLPTQRNLGERLAKHLLG
jgi:hypothetical protein